MRSKPRPAIRDRLVHGEGVAIGMVLAHGFSARLGLASQDTGRVAAHLRAVGLPTDGRYSRRTARPEALMDAIAQDKKVARGALTFILTRGIGQAFIEKDVPASEVLCFLKANHPSLKANGRDERYRLDRVAAIAGLILLVLPCGRGCWRLRLRTCG